MTGILPDANETVKIFIETILKNADETQKEVETLAKLIRDVAGKAETSFEVAASAIKDMGIAIDSDVTKALALAKAFDKLGGSRNSMLSRSPQFQSYKTGNELDEANKLLALDDKRLAKLQAQQEAQARINAEKKTYSSGKELEEANKVLALDDKRLAKLKLQEEAQARINAEKRAYSSGKELEEAEKLDAQWKKLNASIQNGTASVKEFSQYLSSGKLSEGTAKAMQSIRPGDITDRAVNQVRTAMAEIQQITGVSTDKVKSIMRNMFPNIDTRALDIAAAKVQGFPTLAQKMRNSLQQVWNTIKGTLTAMTIFYLTQPISDFFTNAVKAATEARGRLAQLNFGEAILSKAGMDITKKELNDFISYLEEKFKYLSNLEITGIVTEVADMGAEFNLTKEQLLGLSEAVVFLQLKEKAYGQEVSDSGSIINAALDGRSNYFNKLGINITKTAIAEKAYAMGLAERGAQITKEQSNQAAIALLIEQTSEKYDELLASIEQVNPAMANELRVAKATKDAQEEVGEALLGVKDAWNEFLSALIESGSFDSLKDTAIVLINALADLVGLITNLYSTSQNLKDSMGEATGKAGEFGSALSKWIGPLQLTLTLLQLLFLGFTTITGAIVTAIGILSEFFAYASGAKSYEEAGRAVGTHFSNGILDGIAIGLAPLVSGKDDPLANRLKEIMKMLGKDITAPELPDTPTSPKDETILENNEDLQKALEKMNDEILQAQLKLAQDMEDAAINLGRKLEDITIEYARKRADAEIDYMSTVASINADYQNTVADIQSDQAQANAEAHADELQREAEFQEQMRQLKERFLMDLEDALHNRDARQILRLIKQYNMDKENAEREYALQQENAQREQALRNEEFARRRADAERERKAKLAEAQRDYQEKLAKLAADEAAERAAAELAYQRKMQDLEREMQNRLEIVAANLVAEFNLTKDGLDAIVALYKKYYAEVAQIYAAMQAMMAGQANLGGGSAGGSSGKPTGGGSSGGGGGNIKPMAEGGVVIANRPTKAVFGEAGMEMATFTPLGRQGKDVNKIFSNLGGGQGNSGGAIGIEVLLSPDLEGRIVNNTLSQTANVIMKVQRSK